MISNDELFVQQHEHLRATFYVGLASYTVLIWDHLLTFGDEVRFIWRGDKKGKGIIYLFLLNRYLTPFAFILNLYAYFSGKMIGDLCRHFVKYEGATTTIGINIAALMMLLRIRALYWNENKLIVALVGAIFTAEAGTNAWLLVYGSPVPNIEACTMVFGGISGHVSSASAWLPLLFDTVVLILTVKKTYNSAGRSAGCSGLARALLQEGITYYTVIFSVTLVLTLMIAFAPPGLQNIMAQTEYLTNVAMISRITIHLCKESRRSRDPLASHTTYENTPCQSQRRPRSPVYFCHPERFLDVRAHGESFLISIQEQSVTHDDRGTVVSVQAPKKAHHPLGVYMKHTSWEGEEEWIEHAPAGLGDDCGHHEASELV